MNKRSIATLIGMSFFFLLMIAYISYATIAPVVNTENLNIEASTGRPVAFTSTGGGNLSVHVSFDKMTSSSTSVVATTSDTINITLESDGLKEMCCSYDLVWDWKDESDTYTASSPSLTEYEIIGSASTLYEKDASSYSSNRGQLFSKQIPNSTSTDNVIFSDNICNASSSTDFISSSTKTNYNITTNFYNLGSVNQDNLKGKSLSASLKVENVTCTKGLPKTYYYAFISYDECTANGYPTTTTDYTTIGKNVFVRDDTPEEPTRELCIVRNGELHCFQNNNWEVEQNHIQEVFSDISCDVGSSDVRCYASNFSCSVYSDGYVLCSDYSTSESCSVRASGVVDCV